MGRIYKLLVILILLLITKEGLAQKTLVMAVTQVTNTPGTDCDNVAGFCNGSEWEWLWRGSFPDACHEIDNSSANTTTVNKAIWGTNSYWSADCWPSGNISVTFYGQEDDGTTNCDIESGAPSSTNSYAYPAANAGTGFTTLANPVTVTAASGAFGCSCNGNVAPQFSYRSRWEVGGSYSGNNLDGNGFTTNKTCGTAINLGTNTTGGIRTNDVNQCTDAWYYYDLSLTTLSNLTFNNASGTVTVWYDATSSCNTSCQVGSGGGGVSLGGPISTGRYYIRISSNGGRTNLNVSHTIGANSNDFIANATNMGAMPGTGGTLQLNAENNFGSTAESGEPNQNTSDNDVKTDWYSFTTGASVPSKVDIGVEENGDNIDADFHVYKLNDNLYTFPRACVNWSKLTSLGDGDGGDNTLCVGSYNSYRTICVDPSSKYYIQVRGYQNGGLCANEDDGNFRVYATGSATAKGPDDVCSAHNFGTITNNYNSGYIYYNNQCDGTQSGEQRLGDMSNTMWYKFTTPAAGLESVTIDFDEAGEGANYAAVALYQKAGACSGTTGLTERAFDHWCGSDGGSITYTCLPGNTDFYIQGGTGYNFSACTDIINGGRSAGRYRLRLTSSNYSTGPDNICNAVSMGTLNGTTASLSINNQSNICAGTQTNEPSGGQKTVWYTFTTGATVGNTLTVNMDAIGNGLNADVYLYRACGTVCSGLNLNPGVLDQIGNWYDVNPLPGEYDAGGSINSVIIPNTTYYIRADGVPTVGQDGQFNLSVSFSPGTAVGNDNICNAWTVGASNSPGGSGAVHTESITNNNILDPGETITIPTFTNVGASGEDICNANEPNADNNDETVWFKFCTGSTVGTNILVDVDANNGTGGACISGVTTAGWVRIYEQNVPSFTCTAYSAGNVFTQLTSVGSNNDVTDVTQDAYNIKCPKTNQCYYVQVETGGLSTCDMANFTMSIQDNGKQSGPDLICNALDIGTAPYGGPLSNTTNVDLFINNQSNACATVSSSTEPDGFPNQSVDRSVWYKFTTPAPYYTNGSLPHTYEVDVNRLSTSATLSWPTIALWKQTAATTRTCSPENTANSFQNLALVDYTENVDLGDASLENLCLDANSTYYIQIDHATANILTPSSEYVDFSLRVKKDAFRPGDNICNATNLGYITSNGLINGGTTSVDWPLATKFTSAPYFALPHTNKCASTEPGEPNATPGGPGSTGIHTATVWYKFTTGSQIPPNWIYWYNNDNTTGSGTRGLGCIGGIVFNSRVTFYKDITNSLCPIAANLEEQDETNIAGDECDVTTGVPMPPGFSGGAPCFADMFRLKCPEPNTIYYVQVRDAGTSSPCYEGQWSFDNGTHKIITSSVLGSAPSNDSICGAIDLGVVPDGSVLSPSTIFNNFCATPDLAWRADFTQPLDRDVWFRFRPPASGSVRVTAQSAPSGSPAIDNDINLSVSIWDPVLGDGTNLHCSDPRHLWTPIISQDHALQAATEASVITTTYYDIYQTCGNSITCNEGNSLIATCLDPNKYYYLQVDGDRLYPLCDALDGGDCEQGYFKIQIADADLGLYDADNPSNVGTPYTSLGVPNANYKHDEPCFADALTVAASSTSYGSLPWKIMTNRCATSVNDPIPATWASRNASTDKTVWASFVTPASGKVKIRAENINQIKGDPDYHDDLNLQLAVYETPGNCYDKSTFIEVGNGNGFDGIFDESGLASSDDYVGVATSGFDEYYVARCLIPGRTYYIMIDGDAGYVLGADGEDVEGDFRISVQELNGIPASVNDSICDAYNMTPISNTVGAVYNSPIPFNNECATINQSYEGSGKIAHNIAGIAFNFDVEHTLWFKFVAPSTGKVKIEALEDNGVDDIDLGIAIFDIPSQNCTNIQTGGFKFDDDYDPAILGIGGSDDEEITVTCLVPGRTYWVQVDGNSNVTTCLPLGSGTDCETGQFRIRITTLAADPTYTANVAYTSPSTTRPGGNDMFCQAHNVANASGTYNPLDQNTYLNPGETINFAHNNRCATAEQNELGANGWNLNPFSTGNDPTVWYTFNTGPSLGPLRPGDITIRVTNPSGSCFDPDLDLYEYNGTFTTGTCNTQAGTHTQFNNLLRIGEGEVFNVLLPREEEIHITCPKPNKTYFLRVLGTSTCPLFGDDQGDFNVSIAMSNININLQTNDDICSATNLGTLNTGTTFSSLSQNNMCATQEQGESNTDQSCVQNEACYDETVWYTFHTSANPGAIQVVVRDVATFANVAAPVVTVYKYVPSGNPCSSTPFANLADLVSNSGVVVLAGVTVDSAKVTLNCPSPNTDYYIQVDGVDMGTLGFTLPGSTDNFYFNLFVRDLGNGTGRAPNDNLINAIAVDNVAPLDGNLTVSGTLTIGGHNRCATCENGEAGDYCGINQTDHTAALGAEDETVWYYFNTPANPGTISITVADDPGVSGTFSPNFSLYYNDGTSPQFRITNAPTASLIKEGGTNTAVTSTTTGSYTCLLPNHRYYIEVDGNDAVPGTIDQGDFIVTVTDDGSGSPGPSNDLICNAETLSAPTPGAVPLLRTNRCSWEEAGEPNTSSNMGGTGDDVTSNNYDETVWFTFVPTTFQDITLALDVISGLPSGIGYVLYEKSGTANISCTGSPADIPTWSQLTEKARGTATILGGNDITETWPCLNPANRYYIQVDGNDGPGNDVGNFNILLTVSNHATPVNDMICGIGGTVATGNFGTIPAGNTTVTANSQDNRCATQEVGEPSVDGPFNDITDPGYDHTLWYKFIASSTDGTYDISITNSGGDLINGYISLYRENPTPVVCNGSVPTFGNMTLIKESPTLNSSSETETLHMECWEIEEGRTYFIQIQGFDGILGGDVGDNFNVALTFNAGSTNPADNVCTAPVVPVNGAPQSADNRCATTQAGEPNIDPVPQTSANGSDYDETLWYQFVAPVSGEVKLSTSSYSSILLSLNAELYTAPTTCATFAGMTREDYTSTLTYLSTTWNMRCLIPGRTYYLRFDGNDPFTDKGTWNFNLTELNNTVVPPVNDEPCGAIDITQYVRTQTQGPCTADAQYYSSPYSILDAADDIDMATRSVQAIGCNGSYNCNDYWFRFVVPVDATGIRIQGNDEYGLLGTNNSYEHIGIYRATNGCSGPLQQINCGDGGSTSDIDFTLGAFPGETLYIQVFDEDAPASPTSPIFGLCVSVDCPPKTACAINTLTYNQPQCWNMNTNGAPYSPMYYDCLPGSNNSVNYFSFNTNCDGTPVDTVTVVFSVTNLGCNVTQTAMSIFADASPCVAPHDAIVVNCAVFESVIGGSTSTNFTSTFILPGCSSYVMQIIGNQNTSSCSSGGQVLIVQSNLPPSSTLPVELTTFTGYNEGNVNVLNWTTASELNTLKFEVEKSIDRTSFTYIGEKLAVGNSSISLNYVLNDEHPIIGNNYYRLKMIDRDGQFKYSDIINIKVNSMPTMATEDGIMKVYPNPTNGKLNIVYQAGVAQKLNLDVFNVIGQSIFSNAYQLEAGLHTIVLDAVDYAKGVYILNLQNTASGNKYQSKFLKE